MQIGESEVDRMIHLTAQSMVSLSVRSSNPWKIGFPAEIARGSAEDSCNLSKIFYGSKSKNRKQITNVSKPFGILAQNISSLLTS